MFCMECGMQLADGKAKFCGNCGTKVPSASKETDPGVEVLPPSFVQGTLSQGAMESLAKLKEKYPTNIGHKPVSKKRTSESKVMESDEEMPKIELQKPSSKCGGKSLSKISTMQSNDVVESDEEMPKIRLQKPSSKCGGKSLPKISTMQSDDVVESDEEMPKIRLQKPIVESDVELPKVPLPVVESDVELPQVSLPSSKCSGENMPLGRKIKSSTMQSDDLPDLCSSKEESPCIKEDESVFTFACQEINPEILPPSFYFECVSTESCMFANCQHSFKLEECHGINIRDIPDVLLLKEAEYSLDDTLTNYGDVHLRGSVGPVFH
uniref:Zinc-ribbon domain-containing protein n=1 Tax=Magallana gigas TaxID=29159 RepID=A0A8W8JTF0_MAGGI